MQCLHSAVCNRNSGLLVQVSGEAPVMSSVVHIPPVFCHHYPSLMANGLKVVAAPAGIMSIFWSGRKKDKQRVGLPA